MRLKALKALVTGWTACIHMLDNYCTVWLANNVKSLHRLNKVRVFKDLALWGRVLASHPLKETKGLSTYTKMHTITHAMGQFKVLPLIPTVTTTVHLTSFSLAPPFFLVNCLWMYCCRSSLISFTASGVAAVREGKCVCVCVCVCVCYQWLSTN